MKAHFRNLRGEYSDAELVDLDNPKIACVVVPGFGHLIVANGPDGVPRAVLAQGPGQGDHQREVKQFDDGHVEVELLPNRSGEDRIVVVLSL